MRLQGLARLLVLSVLSTDTSRNQYLELRRQKRARPPHPEASASRNWRRGRFNRGDLKASQIEGLVTNNYETVHIPYGRRFNAKKIERLLYQRDIVFNAEWNSKNVPPERPYKLHRHPCFFGDMTDIFEDCCGYCPEPDCAEAITLQQEESERFVRGPITFMIDDPGRQSVGSFNPITEGDWSEMAYLSCEAQFAAAVAQNNVGKVSDMVEVYDVNKRDHTGRTMLFLAGQCGSNDVARILIDKGARLTARNFDGRTILHLACQAGNLELVNIVLQKSKTNALEKEMKKKLSIESEADDSDDGFEKIKRSEATELDEYIEVEAEDILDINVPDWDYCFTPLHHSLFFGHVAIAERLIEEGADVTIPAKIPRPPNGAPWWVKNQTLFPIVLCANTDNCVELAKLLISPGISSQSDSNHTTALHMAVATKRVDLVKVLLENDPKASTVLSHLNKLSELPILPIHTAIFNHDNEMLHLLLRYGSPVSISMDEFLKYSEAKNLYWYRYHKDDEKMLVLHYGQDFIQPLELAVMDQNIEMVQTLIRAGANVNSAPRGIYYTCDRRE